jgi:hypothetical protein
MSRYEPSQGGRKVLREEDSLRIEYAYSESGLLTDERISNDGMPAFSKKFFYDSNRRLDRITLLWTVPVEGSRLLETWAYSSGVTVRNERLVAPYEQHVSMGHCYAIAPPRVDKVTIFNSVTSRAILSYLTTDKLITDVMTYYWDLDGRPVNEEYRKTAEPLPTAPENAARIAASLKLYPMMSSSATSYGPDSLTIVQETLGKRSQETRRLDSHGNPIGIEVETDAVVCTRAFSYTYDEFGNWIKRRVTEQMPNGASRTEETTRDLQYS